MKKIIKTCNSPFYCYLTYLWGCQKQPKRQLDGVHSSYAVENNNFTNHPTYTIPLHLLHSRDHTSFFSYISRTYNLWNLHSRVPWTALQLTMISIIPISKENSYILLNIFRLNFHQQYSALETWEWQVTNKNFSSHKQFVIVFHSECPYTKSLLTSKYIPL